jgi:hypothetical protein
MYKQCLIYRRMMNSQGLQEQLARNALSWMQTGQLLSDSQFTRFFLHSGLAAGGSGQSVEHRSNVAGELKRSSSDAAS